MTILEIMEKPELFLVRLEERQKAMDAKLDAILAQCLKTNGRVDGHDKQLSELNNWRHEVKGNWKATTAIGAIIGAGISFIISFIRNGQ